MQKNRMPALSWHALLPLLLATFAISIGYGIVLPILPFLVERLADTADAATFASFTVFGPYQRAASRTSGA